MAYDYGHAMQILRDARLFAPSLVFLDGRYHVFTRTVALGSGATIEDALQAAGFLPPTAAPSVLFVAVGSNIVRDRDNVAVARSRTMAIRIANALNEYIPGDRGY
jgi:hypothetical protein